MQRPAYLGHIDTVLQNRERLANEIEVASKELLGKVDSRRIQQWVEALRGDATAEDFLSKEELVTVLPFLIAGCAEPENRGNEAFVFSILRTCTVQSKLHWNRLAYPAFITFLASFVFVALAVGVVPIFKKMFEEFELRLSSSTRLLIQISDALVKISVTGLVGFLTACLLFALLIRFGNRLFSRARGTRFLGSMSAGAGVNLIAMSRFAGTAAELLNIGTPLSETVRISGIASQEYLIRSTAGKLASDIQALPEAWNESNVIHCFPPTVIHALQLSDDRKVSAELLRSLSRMYLDRVQYRAPMTSMMSGLAGPFLILGLGFLILVTIAALFMPLITLVTALTGAR